MLFYVYILVFLFNLLLWVIGAMCPLENLTQDILEENLVKCFSPFHVAQIIFGTNRIVIKDRFITNTSAWQRLYTMLCLIMIGISASYFIAFYKHFFSDNFVLCFIFTRVIDLQYLIYFGNLVQVKFFRPKDNIKIYLLLQKIDRILHLDGYDFLNKRHFILNLIVTVSIIVCNSICFWLYNFSLVDEPIHTTILFSFAIVAVYIEILAMLSLIYYLAIRLHFLNHIINTHLNNSKNLISTKNNIWNLLFPFTERFEELASSKYFSCKTSTFKIIRSSFKYILEAFRVISNIYSFQVSN